MINEDVYNKLRPLLMSGGWREIVVPSILNRGREALKALCLNPEERKDRGGDFKNKNDDQLRQIVEESERFATVWDNEVKVYDLNRRSDEFQRQNGSSQSLDPASTLTP